jgi:hypothetical protein
MDKRKRAQEKGNGEGTWGDEEQGELQIGKEDKERVDKREVERGGGLK